MSATGNTPAIDARKKLDGELVRGVAWLGATRVVTQVFSWATLLIVARLLTPADYGVAAASTAAIGLIGMLSEFGLGTAIVSQTELQDDQIAQLATVGVLFGGMAWLAAAMLSFAAPTLLGVSELRMILPVAGLVVAMAAANAVPQAVLKRAMAFRLISRIDFIRTLVGSSSLLLFAWWWRSYWAIVGAEVLATAVATAIYMVGFKYGMRRPVWTEILPALRFSRDVLVGRLAWYVYSNADFFVVGRVLGKGALGDYSMAWTLVTLPNEKIATLVFGVTPSVFAKVRHDLDEMQRYVLLLLESISVLLFPVCFGMALVAPDLVRVALGPKWMGSVPIIQGLAAIAVVRAISPLSSQILVSRGKAVEARKFALVTVAVLPVSFAIATRWGPVGVALVWSLVFPLLAFAQMWAAAKEIALPLRRVGRVLLPPFSGALLMSGAVYLFQSLVRPLQWSPIVTLVAAALVGAVVYAGWMLLVARDRMLAVARRLRRK